MILLNSKSKDSGGYPYGRRIMSGCVVMLAAMMCSCNNAAGIDDSLRQAEAAITEGDVTVAKSVAEKLGEDENLTDMSASQLARLSIVYMELADGDGNRDLAANAADCYRRAYQADKDSADAYYRSLTDERASTAGLLQHLVSAADATYSFEDSVPDHSDDIYFTGQAE